MLIQFSDIYLIFIVDCAINLGSEFLFYLSRWVSQRKTTASAAWVIIIHKLNLVFTVYHRWLDLFHYTRSKRQTKPNRWRLLIFEAIIMLVSYSKTKYNRTGTSEILLVPLNCNPICKTSLPNLAIKNLTCDDFP